MLPLLCYLTPCAPGGVSLRRPSLPPPPPEVGTLPNDLSSHHRTAGSWSLCRPQVVKVVGSNISHKLRLSRVKPTDEGTYECRVIDFSDGKARHHKVKAYLRVQPGENSVLHLPEAPPVAPAPPPPKPGKELRKRSVEEEACSL